MKTALDGGHHAHLAPQGHGLLRASNRFVDVRRRAIMVLTRLREYVEHRPQVDTDPPLKLDNLAVRHVDAAVDVGLKGSGVRHDGPRKAEEFVYALPENLIALRALSEDVRIRDQYLGTEASGQICRTDAGSVRVHDGEERRCRHGTVAGLDDPDAAESVPLQDLEHERPIGPPRISFPASAHLSTTDISPISVAGDAMLRSTFVHISGVGYLTEERLWRGGIRTWDDFSGRARPFRVSSRLAERIEYELDRSQQALRQRRHRYFARCLPSRDQWRAWSEFRNEVAFLDIETTGLSVGRDAVTVVGLYDGTKRQSFVKDDNLEDLPRAVAGAKLLVTFNGSHFDVPFLSKAFPRIALNQIHIDLLHPLRRLGFRGGLKSIESQLGILRSEETSGLMGFDAVRLWHRYEDGDDDALDLLLAYNMEDVVNLEPLAAFAYEGLRSLCLDGGFVTADRLSGEARA